jgi:dihydroorotate dehydrogenase electron transfer subunit
MINAANLNIQDELLTIVKNIPLSSTTNVLVLDAPHLARTMKAGQFINVKVSDSLVPLLRRPFSLHRIDGDQIEVMLKIVGVGTELLYHKRAGDKLLVLGPLGNTFGYATDNFDAAILVSGGIGVAPMAELEKELVQRGKKVLNIVAARTANEIQPRFLSNVQVATDDGSLGFKGNAVQLLKTFLSSQDSTYNLSRTKLFACGPNRMLAALAAYANDLGVTCEVSIESIMGCGIGICYGCPILVKNDSGEVHQKLLCRHGSVMDAKEVMFEE